MPVAKNKAQKVNQRKDEADKEEEVEIEEPEESEEGEKENTASAGASTSRPRKTPIGWDREKDKALMRVMRLIEMGKLKGSLTPEAVREHLQDAPEFAGVINDLTRQRLISHVKTLHKRGNAISMFATQSRKYDVDDLNAELEAELAD